MIFNFRRKTKWTPKKILKILDKCALDFTFPALDNGYVYLANTRLSVFKSINDWAIVIEVFGFSPRSGFPDIQICTFSNNLQNRNKPESYVTEKAYLNYLDTNPFNESRFVFPIENKNWIDEEEPEIVLDNSICQLRSLELDVPKLSEYKNCGISLEEDNPLTFKYCRYLAHHYPEMVLANDVELRENISPEMELLIQLDEWQHPDIVGGELPSNTESFKQLSHVLVTGNKGIYNPSCSPNTHWSNWPEGGTL